MTLKPSPEINVINQKQLLKSWFIIYSLNFKPETKKQTEVRRVSAHWNKSTSSSQIQLCCLLKLCSRDIRSTSLNIIIHQIITCTHVSSTRIIILCAQDKTSAFSLYKQLWGLFHVSVEQLEHVRPSAQTTHWFWFMRFWTVPSSAVLQ